MLPVRHRNLPANSSVDRAVDKDPPAHDTCLGQDSATPPRRDGALTDSSGNIVEKSSFDAYGQRRLADGWADGSDPAMSTAQPRRGFTGHEQLDEIGLVHMNGRIYDPTLGRFMSADPILDPSNPKDLNRYAYVYNNPLSGTDPTGYRMKDVSAVMEPAVRIGLAVAFTAGAGGAVPAGYPIIAGMAGGAAGSAVSGITGGQRPNQAEFWRGVGIGALQGGAFSWIGNAKMEAGTQLFARGAVGGLASLFSGENFQSGFAAAFFSALMDAPISALSNHPYYQGLMTAVVGGTASVVGGGKFVNGAMTAAYARLFENTNETAKPLEQQAGLGLAPGGLPPIAEIEFVNGNPQIVIHNDLFAAESPEYQVGTMIHEMQHVYDALSVGATSYYELYKAYSAGKGVHFGVLVNPTYARATLEIRARTTEVEYYSNLLRRTSTNRTHSAMLRHSRLSSLRDSKLREIEHYKALTR